MDKSTRSVGVPRRVPTIRGRLARILTLPLVAVVVLLGVVVAGEANSLQTANATSGSVNLALGVQDLVQELQEERGLTSGLLGGDVGFRGDIDPERKRVDAERIAVANLTNEGAVGALAVRAALAQLDGLTKVRGSVDAGKAARAATFAFFTDRIAALNNVDLGLDRSPDQVLRRGVTALDALGEAKEQLAQERAFLNGVFSAGGFHTGEYVQFAAMHAAESSAEAQYVAVASKTQVALNTAVSDTGAAREATDFEERALRSPTGLLQVDPQSWWSALTTVVGDTRAVQQRVGADIRARAGKLRKDASTRLGALLVLVLVCAAGALALVIAAARSITGPLARLAAEADSLASYRLPEAVLAAQNSADGEMATPPEPVRVPPRSSSEIRSVADALDRVQATAYTLATEQAVLRRNTTDSLANLGRRNQNLLRRQLGFITRLEREESDPTGLANLFELDHLATRMRRNAESLLVLVGEQSPRAWTAPLPVADVIRAAISEVEEYRRVQLRRVDDAYIAGTFVTGLAHMIAELVENGLAFSPPDLDVEVQGRMLGSQYLIAITDQGVGMEPAELDRANARLRGEESFLMSPTRYLGHYVVGHLAHQMSVGVAIAPSPVTGVTARVTLPATMLVSPNAMPPGEAGAAAHGGNGRNGAGNGGNAAGNGRAAGGNTRAERGGRSKTSVSAGSVGGSGAGTSTAGGRPTSMITSGGYVEPDTSLLPTVPSRSAPAAAAPPRAISGLRPPPVVEYITLPDEDPRAGGAAPPDLWASASGADPRLGGGRDGFDISPPGGFDTAATGRFDAAATGRFDAAATGRFDTVPTGGFDTAATGGFDTSPTGDPAGQDDPHDAGRTRNGLLKRVPRSRATTTTATPVDDRDRPAVIDSSPSEMRSRLTSLRAGVARGENDRPGAQGDARNGYGSTASERGTGDR